MEEHIKEKYYFKVYKNGRYLADIRPEDGQATILVGNYRFEVFDLKDKYIGEVFVQTQVWTHQESFIGDMLIIVAIILAIGMIILISKVSGAIKSSRNRIRRYYS
ncbi:MAG: hypothetical protein PHO91_01110 [Patescibacteria group bacterium]|nr:hypothetical protein [Patescibacteria group bacterium]